MMISNALMRHMIGEDLRLDYIVNNPTHSANYKQILKLIQDNDESATGAFSIQNVAKIGLCHGKKPGEWYGPHSIGIMLKVSDLGGAEIDRI
jgi:hypothetical protein